MRPINEERLELILEYIHECQKEDGCSPTFRQIMQKCGHSSLCLVASDVAKLKDRGLIHVEDGRIQTPVRLEAGKFRQE